MPERLRFALLYVKNLTRSGDFQIAVLEKGGGKPPLLDCNSARPHQRCLVQIHIGCSWARKIEESGAREAWIYFDNDREGFAIKNAQELKRLLRLRGHEVP